MRAFRRLSVLSTSTTAVILAFTVITVGQATQRTKTSNIQIKNFGCINERYYRGAQPKEKDYADLASMGVKTVIDLQRDGNSAEPSLVRLAGMNFYRIPMT